MAHAPYVAGGVSLRELLPDATIVGAGDIRARSCSVDSRGCLSGDVFVAVVGAQRDGHDFARAAVARGAAAVIAERLLPLAGTPQCLVPDAREAWGLLSQALAGWPARRLKVIGITGTAGKTTTGCLVASVLCAAGERIGILGSLGYSDSVEIAPARQATPHPPQLAKWLRRMAGHGCSHAVLEVSSRALVERRLAGVELDAACITNVGHDHLDLHGTLANYRRAKGRLLSHLAGDGLAVLNADDPVCAELLAHVGGPALTFGMRGVGELTAQVLDRSAGEQTFLLSAGSDSVPVRTRIIGDPHVYNCLAAAAVGLAYGIDLPTVVRGLEAIEHVPGRLERVDCGQPFGVFVDLASTPHALAGTLTTLAEVTSGRLICVFAATGGDRGQRARLARAVEQLAHAAIVTSDVAHHEPVGRHAAALLDGFSRPQDVHVIPDRAAAIRHALAMAAAGDTVLIAGRGAAAASAGDDEPPRDDRSIARRYLFDQQRNLPTDRADSAWIAANN